MKQEVSWTVEGSPIPSDAALELIADLLIDMAMQRLQGMSTDASFSTHSTGGQSKRKRQAVKTLAN